MSDSHDEQPTDPFAPILNLFEFQFQDLSPRHGKPFYVVYDVEGDWVGNVHDGYERGAASKGEALAKAVKYTVDSLQAQIDGLRNKRANGRRANFIDAYNTAIAAKHAPHEAMTAAKQLCAELKNRDGGTGRW